MTDKILSYSSFGIAVLTLVLVGMLVFSPTSQKFGAEGDTNFTNLVLSGDATIGDALTVTGAAIFSGTVALNGETTLGNCGTLTWNPGSIASSSIDGISATSTDVAVAGAALGDVCIASLDSATSTSAIFSCNISATATGTITMLNTGTAALDVVTGTAKICYFD